MRSAGRDKGVERKRTIDEVSRSCVHPVKSHEVCDGAKSNASYSIDYRDDLFIFCEAGVIQMARTLSGLVYGTWETAYKCQGKCTIRTT